MVVRRRLFKCNFLPNIKERELGNVFEDTAMLFMKVIPTPEPTRTPNPRIDQLESRLMVRAQSRTPSTCRVLERNPICLLESRVIIGVTERFFH